jgi:hypothetical protein
MTDEATVELAPEQTPIIQEGNLPNAPADNTAEIYQNEFGRLVAPSSQWQVWKENLKVSRHFGLFNSYGDANDEMSGGLMTRQAALFGFPGMREMGLDYQLTQEGKKKLSLEETKKILPYATEPMHEEIAMQLASDRAHVDSRRIYAARGGDMYGVTRFGMEIFRSLTEPSELLLMGATGGLSAAAGLSNSVRSVFMTNLVQNLAVEGAGYSELKREGEEVTPGGVAANSLAGAVLGTGLHFLIGHAKSKIEEMRAARITERGASPGGDQAPKSPHEPMPPTPPDVENIRVLTGIAQHESGQAINPGAVGDATVRVRRSGTPPGDNAIAHYEYTPLDDTADRHFFVSSAGGKSNALTGLGGAALELSDNGNFQNMWGDIAEVKLSKLNLVDIDQRASALPNVLDLIAKSVERRLNAMAERGDVIPLEGGKVSFPLEASIRDILENVKHTMPEALDHIRESLKESGIDGYKYVDTDVDGNPVHNGLVVFDDAKTEVVGHYDQNRDMVPTVPPEEVQSTLGSTDKTQTSPHYEPGVVDGDPIQIEGPTFTEDEIKLAEKLDTDIRAQAAEATKSVKQMMEASPESADHLQAALDQIEEEFQQDVKQSKLARLLGDCFNKGL